MNRHDGHRYGDDGFTNEPPRCGDDRLTHLRPPCGDRDTRFSRDGPDFGNRTSRLCRNLLATVAIAAAPMAVAHWPSPPLATLDVVDRTSGASLAVHEKDGRRYIVGTPGHEYAIRIRNDSRERILAVTSVDGVNVVSGETASPDQSGYVVDAGDSVEIAGWRRSLERTSAFYFTDLGDSYAARTGRSADVGVIGLALFRERRPALVQQPLRDKIAAHDAARHERGDMPASPAPTAQAEAERHAAEAGASGNAADAAPRTLSSKLGTGFGRDETSHAKRVRFERASTSPAETIAIQYDRRENLVAMGVLPAPRYAQRMPDPFPALRFVPAPR
jgi:hypothetical protein